MSCNVEYIGIEDAFLKNIYKELGNKTKSTNVNIVSWTTLKEIKTPVLNNAVVATRIYGEQEHFGNPFSHDPAGKTQGLIKTETIKEAVEKYIEWVMYAPDDRAEWIREQIRSEKLKGLPILYYKELGEPSHATALDYLINKTPITLLSTETNSTPQLTKKEEFNKLKEDFGQYNALYSILQKERDSNIAPGFISSVEQTNRVNAVTLMALNHIKEDLSLVEEIENSDEVEETEVTQQPVIDSANKSLTAEKLDALKEKIKENILGIIDTAAKQSEAGVENADSYVHIANRAYILYRNIDSVFDKVVKNIKNLHVDTDAKAEQAPVEEVGSVDNDEKEASTRMFGKSHLEKSPLESAKSIILFYISTQHKTKYGKNGEVVDVVDDLGMKVPLIQNETLASVYKLLASKHTIQEMIDELKIKGVTDPLMARIANDLENDTMESKTPTKVKGLVKKGFRAAFFRTFRMVYTESNTVVVNEKEDHETKEKYISSFVVSDNSRSLPKTLAKNWFQLSRKAQSQPLQEKKGAWDKVHKHILGKFEPEELRARLNNVKDMEILVAVRQLLSTAGIKVSLETLQDTRVTNKIKYGISFSDTVAGSPKKGISYHELVKKFWEGEDIYSTESTTIGFIARAQASNEKEIALQANLNSNKNLVYPLNLPTSTTDLFDELSSGTGRAESFNTDPVYGHLRLVKLFKEKAGLALSKFSAMTVPNTEGGAEFTDLSPLGSIATRINGWFNASANDKENKNEGYLLFPTPGDRGNSSQMKLPKLKNTTVIGNTIPSGDFRSWAIDFAKAELNRINLAWKDKEGKSNSELVENYHYNPKNPDGVGNAMMFHYLPALNQYLKMDGSPESIDFENPEVIRVLSTSIVEAFRQDVEYLIENKVLVEGSTLEDPHFAGLAKQVIPEGAQTKAALQSFLANTLAFNTEAQMMFVGDLAFFKPGLANLANANKRAGMAETPGTKLLIGDEGSKPIANVAIVKSTPQTSNTIKELNKLLKVEKSAYNGIDHTDGQGLCTLDRWLDLALGQGPVSKQVLDAIAELKKENPDISKIKGVHFQPIKGFLHTNRFNSEFGRIMPMTLKYSILPIYPAMFTVNGKVNNEMKKIYDKMLAGGIDETVFTTTVKFGAYNVNQLEDEVYKTVEIHNEDYRIPQEVHYKEKAEENAGSQIEKIIVGDVIADEFYYPTYSKDENAESVKGAVTGERLLDTYQKALSGNLAENFEKTFSKLTENGVVSEEKVAKAIVKAISSSALNNTPSHIIDSLAVVNGKTVIPMSFPTIKAKVESTIFSIFRKKVTKKTIPGFVGVQHTSLGYDVTKDSVATDQNLKWARLDPTTGKTLPAEIICSPAYFLEALKKMNPTEAVTKAIKELEEGTFDVSNISEELNQIVVYRIPYQGLSSSIPCKIVGFTPEVAGSTIVVPMEMVSQGGVDFDIDKLYIEIKHFHISNEGKLTAMKGDLASRWGRNNIIIDTHYAVLTNPVHQKAMATPNNSNTLLELMGKYVGMYGSNNLAGSLPGNLKTQENFRNEGKDGGKFIGFAADASSFHALLGKWGATQSARTQEGITIDGKNVQELVLGQRENRYGTLISEELSETVTAAVDNSNVPILGNLNINHITGPVFLWLIEAGAGLKYATALINSPIIRELVKETRNREQLLGDYQAFEDALVAVLGKGDSGRGFKAKNDINKALKDQDFDVSKETLDFLGANSADLIRNDAALKAFLTFKKYATDFSSAKTAFKIDVKGAKQSVAENLIIMKRLASISGTYSSEMEHGLPINYNKTFKLDAEKYRNHSMAAYETYGIIEAVNIVSEVVLDNSNTFKQITQHVHSEGITSLNGADTRILFNDIYTSLICSRGLFEENSLLQELLQTEDLVKAVLYGSQSLGTTVIEEQAKEKDRQENDINYLPNRFLMSLKVELDQKGEMVDVVMFDNSVVGAMTTDQKNDMTSEFERLVKDTKIYGNIGTKLLLYNLITEGFGRGINSYSEFIPAKIFDKIKKPGAMSVIEYFRAIENKAKVLNYSPETIAFRSNFTYSFLKNRATRMSSIKDYTNIKNKPNNGLYIDGDALKLATTLYFKGEAVTTVSTVVETINRNKTISGQFIQGLNIVPNTADVVTVTEAAKNADDTETNGECVVPLK